MYGLGSAYPVEQPFIIATKDELLERAAITEVVEMVGKRAKSMEVKFVRNKVEELPRVFILYGRCLQYTPYLLVISVVFRV